MSHRRLEKATLHSKLFSTTPTKPFVNCRLPEHEIRFVILLLELPDDEFLRFDCKWIQIRGQVRLSTLRPSRISSKMWVSLCPSVLWSLRLIATIWNGSVWTNIYATSRQHVTMSILLLRLFLAALKYKYEVSLLNWLSSLCLKSFTFSHCSFQLGHRAAGLRPGLRRWFVCQQAEKEDGNQPTAVWGDDRSAGEGQWTAGWWSVRLLPNMQPAVKII